LPKKAVFDTFKPSTADRKVFDEQISRMAIVAEISPQTLAIAASEEVLAVYVVHVALKVPDCDKNNIAMLSKLIDQRMLFVLQHGDNARLAAYRTGKVLVSDSKPQGDWVLPLTGLDLEAIWENAIAQIGGIDLSDGKDLDTTIIESDRRDKVAKKIEALEKKAMSEKQPRRKWELAEEIKKLKTELEDTKNG
jgi:hypothetical protein